MVKDMFKGTVLLCSISMGLFAQTTLALNTLTSAEKKAGWNLLFDGQSMNHWVDPRQKIPAGDAWTIEDYCLKANRRPHITEDLFSEDLYRDFELAFDWRISQGGNSGVKYRIQGHFFVLPETPGGKRSSRSEWNGLWRTRPRADPIRARITWPALSTS